MVLLRLVIYSFVVYLLLRFIRGLQSLPNGRPPPDASRRSQGQGGTDAAGSPGRSHDPTPFEVLGVSSHASPDEIQAAYRTLVQQYHPDQVAHLGAELREVALRRTKEINAAYNLLKRG